MKLIDTRPTPHGLVVDVKLENADLSFSMPYDEYCQLETAGELTDEAAIDSNIRFMSHIRKFSGSDYKAEIDAEPLSQTPIVDEPALHT